jgi:uncharacterized repeat protein (TIGR03803 family)
MIFVVSVFCIAAALASPAQTFTTLISFNFTDGSGPNAQLVQGTDGNFYGTTLLGGSSNNCIDGCGSVFKVTANGALTTLHNFDGTDGSSATGILQGVGGNFYGTTANGGTHNNCTGGCGTVFKMTSSGKLTSLHSFDGTDGSGPYSGLIQGTDGSFYGITSYGGANNSCANGCGTVFKITAEGAISTLYNFDDAVGFGPSALIQGTDGNFYGTAFSGGANSCGTIFKVTPRGALSTLHSFDGTDGCDPVSLIQGPDGSFHGTTEIGGATTNGTIFMMTPKGDITTLHSFDNTDGYAPGGLVQGTDGNFYGTTQGGGTAFFGTVFQITANGALTTLYNFDNSDGADPQSAPVQSTSGTFYGTAYGGGADGSGTVFSLSMGLGPFVKTNPTFGSAGTKVTILGNNLAGTTNVTFNGTKATFTASSSYVTATVPADATTGTVEVVTPKRTLKSNVPFRVP